MYVFKYQPELKQDSFDSEKLIDYVMKYGVPSLENTTEEPYCNYGMIMGDDYSRWVWLLDKLKEAPVGEVYKMMVISLIENNLKLEYQRDCFEFEEYCNYMEVECEKRGLKWDRPLKKSETVK